MKKKSFLIRIISKCFSSRYRFAVSFIALFLGLIWINLIIDNHVFRITGSIALILGGIGTAMNFLVVKNNEWTMPVLVSKEYCKKYGKKTELHSWFYNPKQVKYFYLADINRIIIPLREGYVAYFSYGDLILGAGFFVWGMTFFFL